MSDNLLPYDGELYFNAALLETAESDALYSRLRESIDWEQRSISLFGKRMLQPRLIAWHGDVGANYRYSGADYIAQPWTFNTRCRIVKSFWHGAMMLPDIFITHKD